MTYKMTNKGIERPYDPERDLFRLLKYKTYDLLELDDLDPEDIDKNEITDEEYELIDYWYNNLAGEEE